MGVRSICILTCFSCISLFLNNSAESRQVGSVNGIGMTFSGLFRALGPTIGGAIFSWSITVGHRYGFPFDVNMVFVMFGFVFVIGNVLCSVMPERLNHKTVVIPRVIPKLSIADTQVPLLSNNAATFINKPIHI